MGVPGGVESAKVHWDAGAWGLGWEVRRTQRRHWIGELTSSRTFVTSGMPGHFCGATTMTWHLPFSVIARSHRWDFHPHAVGARLSNAVVAAATR